MHSRYSDADAARAIADLRGKIPPHLAAEPLALRTYTARLLGADPALVLHGGGNTSVKAQATTLFPGAHRSTSSTSRAPAGTSRRSSRRATRPSASRRSSRYRALPAMTDEDMVNELRANLLDASAPTPSVETLLHAFLPHRFIDHTHADAILALADQPDGERICRDVFGAALVWVPYVMPGFALAKRTARGVRSGRRRGALPHGHHPRAARHLHVRGDGEGELRADDRRGHARRGGDRRP